MCNIMGKLQSKINCSTSKYRPDDYVEDDSPAQAVQQYIPAHTDAVTSVAALTSDLCVSGGNDKTVVVDNWRSGAVLKRFVGHQREVTKVACVFESNSFFSASRDKTVMMWELHRNSGPSQHFPGHDLVVTGLAVSPDSLQLCTGSRDNTMCKWDIETGECVRRAAISRNLDLGQPGAAGGPYVPSKAVYSDLLRCKPGRPVLHQQQQWLWWGGLRSHTVGPKADKKPTCLATVCLDGSGPLASLAVCDSSTLLCASFNSGIHLLRINSIKGLELQELQINCSASPPRCDYWV
ncbi:WD repeat-containing protein 31 isoform X5 [Lepidochelys kempii]|uniref:WD repeat-containing protein 31 isoform X5 n=1 Tax=Lepidochelys kempii TaxID=8472 RepID=UPI003C704484